MDFAAHARFARFVPKPEAHPFDTAIPWRAASAANVEVFERAKRCSRGAMGSGSLSMPNFKRTWMPLETLRNDTRRMSSAPWHALVVLRGTVALIFMAHALVRLVNGSVPRFAGFLESEGFVHGATWVLAISACEIVGGLLLAFGVGVRCVCFLLACIVVRGIGLIHARQGWFVGEHGVGGMEFSVLLCAALLVIACSGRSHWSGSKSVLASRIGGSSDDDAESCA